VACAATPESNESSEHRYLIQFSQFARLNILNLWKGDRSPVKYEKLEDLGIDPSTLIWEPMPEHVKDIAPVEEVSKTGVTALTVAEAKRGLALTFNVPPEAIEITIRG